MSDGRKNNGGHSTKAKKPTDKRLTTKAEEIRKAEVMDGVASLEEAYERVWELCKAGDFNALKFWIEQRAGKANETKDVTVNSETVKNFIIESV